MRNSYFTEKEVYVFLSSSTSVATYSDAVAQSIMNYLEVLKKMQILIQQI